VAAKSDFVAALEAVTGLDALIVPDDLADALETVVVGQLTAAGARVRPAADNIAAFWDAAVAGVVEAE
jgi:hypothetical protein